MNYPICQSIYFKFYLPFIKLFIKNIIYIPLVVKNMGYELVLQNPMKCEV